MTAGYISKRTESKDSNRYLNNAFNVHGYFPGGSDGKAFACNAGVLGLIPGLGRSPGEEKVTHSSILAWRIPWTIQSIVLQRVGHD